MARVPRRHLRYLATLALLPILAGPAAASPLPERDAVVAAMAELESLRDLDRRATDSSKTIERRSRAVFERRYDRHRAEEALLAERFGQTISRHELQAELDRMARQTRRPERLRQVFERLGNDPALIAEVLVRPALVEKQLRSARRRELAGKSGGARLDGGFDAWLERQTMASDGFAPRATEPLVLPRILGQGSDAPDSWTLELPEAPQAKRGQSSTWTGAELIVWGGVVAGPPSSGLWTNAGYSYDPVTDTWRAIRIDDNTPSPRAFHSAVWTGDELIVWGGETWSEEAMPPYFVALGDGGRYDPVEDRWSAIPGAGAPSPRLEHAAVWTGSELIVWGGLVPEVPMTVPPPAIPEYTALDDGARYDPAFGGWSAMGDTPPSARGRSGAVWTGDTLLVVGGFDGTDWLDPASDGTAFAAYDPAADSWNTALPQPPSGGPMSPPFEAPVALWTGESLWVAQPASGRLLTRWSGGAWSQPPPPPATPDRRYASLAWTGRRLLLWGGVSGMPGSEIVEGGGLVLDTDGDTWSSIPAVPGSSPSPRFGHFGTWTGAEMLLWGGFAQVDPQGGTARGAAPSSTGGRFAPDWAPVTDGGSWQGLPVPPIAAADGHGMVWTGSELILWGGRIAEPVLDGTLYDPLLDRWSSISQTDAPTPRADHVTVWTGNEMIVWGGRDAAGTPLSSGGRYDPALDQWSATGGTPPIARADHAAVWTGSEMIVWGGFDAAGTGLASGGRYDPALDQWSPTGGTPPAARGLHAAVWTGDAMVIHGGLTGCPAGCTPAADAAVYDPTLDQWSAAFAGGTGSAEGAASPRWGHRAVWDGSTMLAWGGTETYGDTNICLADGLAVDPAGAMITPLAAHGEGRCRHSATWNGAEMIVWGGSDRINVLLDGSVPPETPRSSGGRYDPLTATWTDLPGSTTSPPGTQGHTAIWTGEEMLVWGGRPEISGALAVYYTDTVPTASPALVIDGAPGNIVLLGGDVETITLGSTLPVALFDDVEGDPRWTAGQEGGTEGVVSGWHVAVAGNCSAQADHVSPPSAWRFGVEEACDYAGDPGIYTLTSQDGFEITEATVLELRYLLGTDRVGNPAEQDGARIEVSADDGASWTTVAIDLVHSPAPGDPEPVPLDDHGAGWRGLALALEPYVGTTTQGRLRFVFERAGSLNDAIGWLIDDISLGEPAGDGRLPGGVLVASDGSVARHAVAAHDRWDRPSFHWDLDGDGVGDNVDPAIPDFTFTESELASYGIDAPGEHSLVLTVEDLGGQSDSAMVMLEVVDGEPPTVTVLSPNGGEAWAAGSTQTITWTAGDNIGLAGFELAYYDDEAGDGPIAITCDEVLDGESRSCTWQLPDLTSTAMRVEVTAFDQRPAPDGPNSAVDSSDAPFYLVQANADEIRTLIAWHGDRIEARHGTAEAQALGAGLAMLAAHPKIDGVVLDLANVPSLDALYAAWDGTAWATGTTTDLDDNIAQANLLAEAVRLYLFEQVAQSFTNLETLILVGGDSSIPFWRLAEDLPRYPESNYVAELQTFGFLDDASSPEAFCDETEHPVMAAICRDHYVADTPYGASFTTDVPGSSFTWWMPDLAVGRMVETPEQILALVDVFIAQDGVTVVDRALASGYDFLTDGGDAVYARLVEELDLGTTEVVRLSQAEGLWSDDDLLAELFGVAPTEPVDLAFVDGHADHRAEGAAAGGDAGVLTTTEMDAAMLDNRGAVLVGVGCHSALSIEPEGGAADELDPAYLLDLPELLASRSFPAMVGNGGYGWGLSEGVGLGEQLVLLVADEMLRAGQISLGEALRLAKQEYFLRQDRLDAFDHKVLHEAMLFGIPNYELRLELAPVGASPLEGSWTRLGGRRAERDGVRAHGPRVPGRPWLGDPRWQRLELGAGRGLAKRAPRTVVRESGVGETDEGAATLRILDFSFTAFERGQDTDGDPKTADWQEAYEQFDWCLDGEGESVSCSGAPDETPVGTFFTLDRLASNESGRPIQPMISFDSRLFGSELHGILIRGGEVLQPAVINPLDPARCTDVEGTVHPCFDPVIGNPESEVDEPEGAAPTPFINIDSPTPFINIDSPTPNGFFENGAGGDPIRFDTLNAPMGVTVRRGVRELEGGEREEIFSQWLYRTRDFTNYYSNSADWTAPVIGDFTADCLAELEGDDCFHTQAGNIVTFDVPASDDGEGIFKVFVTYTQDVDSAGDGAWTTLELIPTGGDRFGGEVVLERSGHYLVQAVDWAGNIGSVMVSGDDVGADGQPIGSTFELPRLFAMVLPADPPETPLFADGFESGDTTAWSGVVP